MDFYNTRLTSELRFTLQDGPFTLDCEFIMGAHRRNHHLTLTLNHPVYTRRVVILGKDLAKLHWEMQRLGDDLFQDQCSNFTISDQLLLLRKCDMGGAWETCIAEIQSSSYKQLTETVKFRLELPLTNILYNELITRLDEVLQLNYTVIEYEQDKPLIQIYQRVSILDAEEAPELFLTEIDATRDPTKVVLRDHVYETLLELQKIAFAQKVQAQPDWGSEEKPIVLEDTAFTELHLDEPPSHVVFQMQAVRPTPDQVCRHLAACLYRKKIMYYGQPQCEVYGIDQGWDSQEFIMPKWTTFQMMCTDILYQLNYRDYGPTANYCSKLLGDFSPDSPYHVAMNSLNYRGCMNEVQFLTHAVLDSIWKKFSNMYF